MTQHNCDQWPKQPAEELKPSVSRRAFLTAAATSFAVLGMPSIANAALAASTQVKACKTSAVPVRGMKAYKLKGKSLIITQPKKGTFRVFSSACTHEGARVTGLSGTNLVCPEHGARYDTTTGAVTGGPAPKALKKYKVVVKNGYLFITV
ncbi:MAG: hypothetical protein RL441_803 [Actinomycetota bacterium]|jgi:nitrite reductase/ring-hydroxylating ferredoxin subunit